MAITAYTGLPGSGKSYSIFEYVVVPALKAGREVWTNIPFDLEKTVTDFGYCPNAFTTQDILDNPRWFSDVLPKGVICIIDEAWRLWPSGIKASNANPDHMEFLAEHRHLVGEGGHATEIIIATQDLTQVAAFARNLVDKTYRMQKLDAVGQDKRFRVDIFQGVASGPNPPKSGLLDQRFGSYRKEIYQYYKSQTKSDIETIGDESRADKRHNMLAGNWLKYRLAFIIVAAVFVLWGFGQVTAFFGADEKPVHDPEQQKVQVVQPGTPAHAAVLDVIKGRDIYIAMNLTGTDVEYVFSVIKDQETFRLTMADIQYLGYDLKPVNECLVLIRVNGVTYQATCRTGESRELLNLNLAGSTESKSL